MPAALLRAACGPLFAFSFPWFGVEYGVTPRRSSGSGPPLLNPWAEEDGQSLWRSRCLTSDSPGASVRALGFVCTRKHELPKLCNRYCSNKHTHTCDFGGSRHGVDLHPTPTGTNTQVSRCSTNALGFCGKP